VELTVTIPPSAVASAVAAALAAARKRTPVPGFRKGAAVPDALVVDALGGPAAMKAAAAEVILTESLPTALGPYAASAISGSERITDNIDALAAALSPSSPFSYHVAFDVLPPLTWVGAIKGQTVKVAAAGDDASVAAGADAQLVAARKEKGKLQLVAAVRPQSLALAPGDVAVIDFDCLDSSDTPIPGAARGAVQLDTADADRLLGVPGLVAGMEGMTVGEERSIPVTLPTNWEPPSLAGAAATAKVRVRELLTWSLPDLTDAWAEEAYPGSSTVDGLRARLRAAVEAETVAATEAKVQEALTTLLADAVACEVPETVLREIGEAEYQSELLRLQSSGRFSLDQISRLATPDLLTKFIDSRRDTLCGLHRAQRAVEEVFAKESLAIDDAAYDAELGRAVADFEAQGQEYDRERLEEQVRETLKGQAVIAWLKANNSVEVGPPEPPRRSFGG
jgi:trigger factor